MTAIQLGSFVVESDEWNEARRWRLGGSEIAAVLGKSPYESRFSLWLRKAGLVGKVQGDGLMTAGRYVEAACAAWFQDQHPEYDVRETGTWIHLDRPWQLANPDRLIYLEEDWQRYISGGPAPEPRAILECKFAPYGDDWGKPGTDEIPDPYKLQTRWYSSVFDDLPVKVAALVGGSFGEWEIEQDADDIATMLAAGRQFLDTLEAGHRPDIDDHEATYTAVREIHPDIEAGEDFELDDASALEYLESKDAVAAAEKRHRKARSVVLDRMGNANYATWQDTRIARRQSSNGNTPHLASTRKDPRDKKPARTTEGTAA